MLVLTQRQEAWVERYPDLAATPEHKRAYYLTRKILADQRNGIYVGIVLALVGTIFFYVMVAVTQTMVAGHLLRSRERLLPCLEPYFARTVVPILCGFVFFILSWVQWAMGGGGWTLLEAPAFIVLCCGLAGLLSIHFLWLWRGWSASFQLTLICTGMLLAELAIGLSWAVMFRTFCLLAGLLSIHFLSLWRGWPNLFQVTLHVIWFVLWERALDSPTRLPWVVDVVVFGAGAVLLAHYYDLSRRRRAA